MSSWVPCFVVLSLFLLHPSFLIADERPLTGFERYEHYTATVESQQAGLPPLLQDLSDLSEGWALPQTGELDIRLGKDSSDERIGQPMKARPRFLLYHF